MDLFFFINSVLFGVGLAMDAFSVSIANGLSDPGMSRRRMNIIAGVYAFFQFLMPVLGWFCVHTLTEHFKSFQPFIPWIALILLVMIGGEMLHEGISGYKTAKTEGENSTEAEKAQTPVRLTAFTLLLQGIATSIDALSVGFAIPAYSAIEAFLFSLIVAVVTYGICMGGLLFGKRFGKKLAQKAPILGGAILIGIGLEIWIKGLFF